MELEEIKEIVKCKLSQKRYEHTLAVQKLANELAQRYDIDIDKSSFAAILHDATKEVPKEIQLQLIKKSDIIVDDIILQNPNLYHSVTGFLFARDDICITDNEILNAILYHTTARKDMCVLEKIIFIADSCAYDRNYCGVQKIRELAFINLDECLINMLEKSISIVVERRQLLALDTIKCYNSLLKI